MVAVLLQAEADAAVVNDDKESAVALAAKYGHREVVVSLLDAGVSGPNRPYLNGKPVRARACVRVLCSAGVCTHDCLHTLARSRFSPSYK